MKLLQWLHKVLFLVKLTFHLMHSLNCGLLSAIRFMRRDYVIQKEIQSRFPGKKQKNKKEE